MYLDLLHGKMDCIYIVRRRCQITGDQASICIQKSSNAEKDLGSQMDWAGSSWEGMTQRSCCCLV